MSDYINTTTSTPVQPEQLAIAMDEALDELMDEVQCEVSNEVMEEVIEEFLPLLEYYFTTYVFPNIENVQFDSLNRCHYRFFLEEDFHPYLAVGEWSFDDCLDLAEEVMVIIEKIMEVGVVKAGVIRITLYKQNARFRRETHASRGNAQFVRCLERIVLDPVRKQTTWVISPCVNLYILTI